MIVSDRNFANAPPNRRDFSSVAIALLACLASTGCQLGSTPTGFVPDKAAESISKKLSVPIDYADRSFTEQNRYSPITGSQPYSKSMADYEPIFVDEFAYYPAKAIARCQLKKIIFCRDLTFEGAHLAALPDYDHDAFYLDVELGSAEYKRKVIHHEFFHIIDWKDDGLVYTDTAWAALNPAGFKYGKGGKSAQNDPSGSLFDSSLKGFVSRYALSGVEEDKAETFANMMVNYKLVDARTQTDPVLKGKVARIKELLRKFDSSFDEDFWSAVAKRAPLSVADK